MVFHPIRAEDKKIFDGYFRQIDSRSCDMCFPTMFLWSDYYNLTWTEAEDMLIVKSEYEDGWIGFYFPIGSSDPTRAIQAIEEYCGKRDVPVRLFSILKENEEWLDTYMPGRFSVTYNRDVADYMYDRRKLVALSGKKYHGKKNHVNKFKRAFENWAYEPITQDNVDDCLAMLNEWKKINSVDKDYEKHAESCVARKSLINLDMLGEKGGLIRAEGRVVAFTIGEKLNSDTFVVHIEKAFADVPGAYAIVNQQFLEHEAGDCLYVNREDDAGEEGLRQAKVSYHPLFMIEKGLAVKKNIH